MATSKTTAQPKNRVSVYVPRGNSNEEPNVFISVGGKNYILPKGKTSDVPPEVAEVYRRCQYYARKLDDTRDRLLSAGQKPIM